MKKIIALFSLMLLFISTTSAQEDQILNVMTYNIHHGQGMDKKVDIERIGNIILENKAGLVALQEVDRGVQRTNKIDIMQLLADQTAMNMAFGGNIVFQGGDYGNGILSKFKVDSSMNHHYMMLRQGEQRGLLRTIIEINGKKVVFISTHTGDKSDDIERQMNAQEIRAVLNSSTGMPVIICGDFNDQPGSKMHEAMKENFIDVWELLSKETGYSFPSVKPDRRIDYIYISKDALKMFRPVSIKVIQTEASDHIPVIASFRILQNK